MICCQVPRLSAPSTKGTVSDGPSKRGADVAGAVVVAPAQMMPVVGIARREPIEQPVEVADGARLELDRGDGGRGSDDEHRDDPAHEDRYPEPLGRPSG